VRRRCRPGTPSRSRPGAVRAVSGGSARSGSFPLVRSGTWSSGRSAGWRSPAPCPTRSRRGCAAVRWPRGTRSSRAGWSSRTVYRPIPRSTRCWPVTVCSPPESRRPWKMPGQYPARRRGPDRRPATGVVSCSRRRTSTRASRSRRRLRDVDTSAGTHPTQPAPPDQAAPLDLATALDLLPKVELHCHVEGTMRPGTVLELAKRQGLALPTDNLDELYSYGSLNEFLDIFWLVQSTLGGREDWARLGYESVVDAAVHGRVYAELFFTPARHLAAGQRLADVVAGLDE